MALGMNARREAESAFSGMVNWSSSTGNLRGTAGAPFDLGWLNSRKDAGSLRESARTAVYTVWSYDTPIGWVRETDTNMEWIVPEENHSNTTAHHQGVLRSAWHGLYHNGTPEGRARWQRERGDLAGIKRQVYLYREYRDDDLLCTRRRPRRAVDSKLRESYNSAFHWIVIQGLVAGWALESPEDPAIPEHVVLQLEEGNGLDAVGMQMLEVVRAAYPHHHDGSVSGRERWKSEVGLGGKPTKIGRRSTDPFGLPFERPDGAPARVAR